ncbi:hypothetical protein GALL_100830 [mine drainage metagenome]|uniref:Lipoprotein n=1 Tax=mine drainage metagenome TaxID=410659 RepID=A0A1J5SH77_9ZZZZ
MVLMLNRDTPTSRSDLEIIATERILIRKFLSIAALPIVCGLFSGCTSQQLYGTGQEYQRNQCLHIPDKAESDRCLGKINTSYDDYKREKDSGAK